MRLIKMQMLFLQTAWELQKYDSFRSAAGSMGVGGSAISYRLKKVEEWVGAGQLYWRRRGRPDGKNPDNPNLKMTPAGEAFIKGMKGGIDTIVGAKQDAQAISKMKGRVTKNRLRVRKTKPKARKKRAKAHV